MHDGALGPPAASESCRLGLPLVLATAGGLIGAATIHDDGSTIVPAGPLVGGFVGLAGGMLAAASIDATWLAWEPGHDGASPGAASSPHLALVPRLTLKVGARRSAGT